MPAAAPPQMGRGSLGLGARCARASGRTRSRSKILVRSPACKASFVSPGTSVLEVRSGDQQLWNHLEARQTYRCTKKHSALLGTRGPFLERTAMQTRLPGRWLSDAVRATALLSISWKLSAP